MTTFKNGREPLFREVLRERQLRDWFLTLGANFAERIVELGQHANGNPNRIRDTLAMVVARDIAELEAFLASGAVDLEHLSPEHRAQLFVRLLGTEEGSEALTKAVTVAIEGTRDALALMVEEKQVIAGDDDGTRSPRARLADAIRAVPSDVLMHARTAR